MLGALGTVFQTRRWVSILALLVLILGVVAACRGDEPTSTSSPAVLPAPTPPVYVLVGVGVSCRARRQGLADLLLDTFEHRVWQSGYQAIRLTVYPSNTAAIGLYETRGWKRDSAAKGSHALKYVLSRS